MPESETGDGQGALHHHPVASRAACGTPPRFVPAPGATRRSGREKRGEERRDVSNVINAPSKVREPTQQKVRAAIESLGYSPNAMARRLRTQRTSTIGVRLDAFSGGISGVVLGRFVHALTEHASTRGLRVLLYAARTVDEELRHINEFADGGEVDAIILTNTAPGDPRAARLRERGIPFAAFGRPWGAHDLEDAGHPWADIDGAAGTRAATEHLLERAGERIAFLGWPSDSGSGDDRERGWREAMGARAGDLSAPRLISPESVSEAQATVQLLPMFRRVLRTEARSTLRNIGSGPG